MDVHAISLARGDSQRPTRCRNARSLPITVMRRLPRPAPTLPNLTMTLLRSLRRSLGPREAGQTLPILVLFMIGFLGVMGLVIDGGGWYQQKQAVQAAADAAALAGASELPAGWSAAQAGAGHEYTQNGKPSDTVSVSRTTDLVSGDSVTVTATRAAPTYFTRLFG